jgi:hypothetical protein
VVSSVDMEGVLVLLATSDILVMLSPPAPNTFPRYIDTSGSQT